VKRRLYLQASKRTTKEIRNHAFLCITSQVNSLREHADEKCNEHTRTSTVDLGGGGDRWRGLGELRFFGTANANFATRRRQLASRLITTTPNQSNSFKSLAMSSAQVRILLHGSGNNACPLKS
jgi:hypothetical protein